MIFVAIDFETADPQRDSACAVGVVRVEHGAVVRRVTSLIRPPRKEVHPMCQRVHGLGWECLRTAKPFADVWASLAGLLDGAEQLVAHNAAFDRSVVLTCCRAAGIDPPTTPWACTLKLATARLPGLPSYRLPDVCRHLGVPVGTHHEAGADAEMCAGVMLALERLEAGREDRTGDPRGNRPDGGGPGEAAATGAGGGQEAPPGDRSGPPGGGPELGVGGGRDGPGRPTGEAPGGGHPTPAALLARVRELGGVIEVGADGRASLKPPADPAARKALAALAPELARCRAEILALATEPTACPKCGGVWFCPPAEIPQLARGPYFCPRGRTAADKDRTGRVLVPADPGCPFKTDGW